MRCMGLQEQIEKAKKIHNNKYDYSYIKTYKGVMDLYNIKCPEHGVWQVTLDNHINKKSGCPKCRGHKLTTKEKTELARKIHKYKYSYELINGLPKIINHEKYDIICPEHGVFNMRWTNHTNMKQGCPKCNTAGRKSLNKQQIIKQIKDLNTEFKYDWNSLKGYYNNSFRIKCSKHGWFHQQPSNHLQGQRCRKCNNSKGEDKIEELLKLNNIEFETQKSFPNLKMNQSLLFDFYIPELNLCIEFDGELHFKPVKFFGGEEEFKRIKKSDSMKNKYCKENNIKLLRIPYTEYNNIEEILNKIL